MNFFFSFSMHTRASRTFFWRMGCKCVPSCRVDSKIETWNAIQFWRLQFDFRFIWFRFSLFLLAYSLFYLHRMQKKLRHLQWCVWRRESFGPTPPVVGAIGRLMWQHMKWHEKYNLFSFDWISLDQPLYNSFDVRRLCRSAFFSVVFSSSYFGGKNTFYFAVSRHIHFGIVSVAHSRASHFEFFFLDFFSDQPFIGVTTATATAVASEEKRTSTT